MNAALVDECLEIREHVGHGGVAAAAAVGREHRLERAEDSQRPAAQRAALRLRDAKQVPDDSDGDRRGKVFDQVDLAFLRHRVEQAVDQRDEPGFHRRDVALRQRAHDRAPHARMQGWIVENEARRVVFEQGRGPELRPELFFLVRAERLRIAIDGEDVVVARQEPRAIGHRPHGVVLTQRPVVRVGIVVELRWQTPQVELTGDLARLIGGELQRHR